ncbi:AfsR/SARP family transcriptional regulator [Streptomyces olivaceiscleroticus]|uniref:AfsR/SARP family transcriptional regulator n=1 Tax=Streptomyces olivaceiscleroticus TaxID=68245 RepID=UPI0031F79E64
MLNFSILGALEVRAADGRTETPSGLQRALVQTLLVSRAWPLPGGALIREMWGVATSDRQVNALHAHISRLRRRLHALEPERATSRLVMHPSGYRLSLEEGELDAAVFARRVEQAEAAGLDSRPERTARLLRSALVMWRGPVFGDNPGGAVSRVAATRYEELRMRAMELLFDVELVAGRHGAILAELRATHLRHPFRERFCEQLMVALYRAGRQAEALNAYRHTGRRLSEELGVDPCPALRRTQQAILSQDPTLDTNGRPQVLARSA